MTFRSFIRRATACLLFAASSAASAATYSVTDLGALPNSSYTTIGGLNESGVVVGTGEGSNLYGTNRALVWTPAHELSDFTALISGATGARGTDINDAGTITGTAYGTAAGTAFTLSATGQLKFLTSPQGRSGTPSAINNRGEVVGQTDGSSGTRAAYWDANGTFRDLGTDLGGFSAAYDINDNGDIVGLRGTNYKGFVRLADSTIIDIVAPGKDYTSVMAINNSGMVVGSGTSFFLGIAEAFVWTAQSGLTTISLANGGAQQAYDVNDAGVVVGSGYTSAGSVAFSWSASTGGVNLNDLIDPSSGWQLQSAQAINEAGQIAGFGMFEGSRRAFLLTPSTAASVPEPASWALMLVGFGCVGGAMRRREKVRAA